MRQSQSDVVPGVPFDRSPTRPRVKAVWDVIAASHPEPWVGTMDEMSEASKVPYHGVKSALRMMRDASALAVVRQRLPFGQGCGPSSYSLLMTWEEWEGEGQEVVERLRRRRIRQTQITKGHRPPAPPKKGTRIVGANPVAASYAAPPRSEGPLSATEVDAWSL